MILNILFFTGLEQIQLGRTSANGERFLDRFHITNDRQKIKSLVEPVKNFIGSVECAYLTSHCPALVYSSYTTDIESEHDIQGTLESQTIDDLAQVQGFLEKLWIIKDNSAFQDRGWLVTKLGGRIFVHSNIWNVRHTTASGSYEVVKFTEDDVRNARLLTSPVSEFLFKSRKPTALTSHALRFQRFMYFVQIARSSPDVAMKVVQYFSALEAFVSSSTSELTHQVSERVASIVEPAGAGRLTCFKALKKGYGFRSQAVHGSGFKTSGFEALITCSLYVDQICRRLAEMYLLDVESLAANIEKENEQFNEFFQQKIFGR